MASDVITGVSYDLPDRLLQGDALMVASAENFDSFLLDWQMKHPSVWRDRIPKGKFPNFKGMSQKSYVFRGSLGPQAGLTDWTRVEQSRKESDTVRGLDACTYNPQTFTWSYDAIDFAGVQTSWRSPSICANDMQYLTEAVQQLGMIISAGAQVTDQVMETFNREQYMLAASNAGKFIVLAEGVGLDYIGNPLLRASYNPYSATSLTFSADLLTKMSILNFDILDLVHQYMSDQAPDAAMRNDGGMPIFTLMIDLRDFERMVLNTPELREDFRRAIPERLIEGFNMGFKMYRGWALMHDVRQARFIVGSVNSTGSITCTRVLPRIATRPGIIGLVPESNPEYVTAEIGTAVVFLQDTLQLLVPAPINSLGSGMTFGPAPDFNGTWTWLNIASEQDNPLNEKGYFFSRYRYFVKQLRYAQDVTVLVYRRCVAALKNECRLVERSYRASDSALNVSTVAEVAAGFVAATAANAGGQAVLKLAKPLSKGMGAKVNVTNDAGTVFAGYIIDSDDAPTYTIGWVNGGSNVPSASTEIDGATTSVAIA